MSPIALLLGLQSTAERLIALGECIPKGYAPDWFAESRKMLKRFRSEQLELLPEISDNELRQFLFLHLRDDRNRNKIGRKNISKQTLLKMAKKLISVPLKAKARGD